MYGGWGALLAQQIGDRQESEVCILSAPGCPLQGSRPASGWVGLGSEAGGLDVSESLGPLCHIQVPQPISLQDKGRGVGWGRAEG